MHLHFKPSSKVLKPCSVVDPIFKAQGFEKKRKKDITYFHLTMKDSITRASYELQIPYQEVYQQSNSEPLYKIQEIYIYPISPRMKNVQIPTAVANAANEKVHEVFSYLNIHPRKIKH